MFKKKKKGTLTQCIPDVLVPEPSLNRMVFGRGSLLLCGADWSTPSGGVCRQTAASPLHLVVVSSQLLGAARTRAVRQVRHGAGWSPSGSSRHPEAADPPWLSAVS